MRFIGDNNQALLLSQDPSIAEIFPAEADFAEILDPNTYHWGTADFANQYWLGGVGLIGGPVLAESPMWGDYYPVAGANGRLAFVGVTRDEYGSPLGNCTVKCFRSVDDSLQSSVVSDGNGVYTITTPYADGHYLVVYKVGPPDICGTTVNTLAPG